MNLRELIEAEVRECASNAYDLTPGEKLRRAFERVAREAARQGAIEGFDEGLSWSTAYEHGYGYKRPTADQIIEDLFDTDGGATK